MEAAIGELSPFHESNGMYAEGVHVAVAVLPEGWRDRIHGWPLTASLPAHAWFLDVHDIAASKLVAGRPKDLAFVTSLLDQGLVSRETLAERLQHMPPDTSPIAVERALRHVVR